jgi:hypothetical protein
VAILGYHGTSATHAAVILRNGFVPSYNDYDCLGDGVYFFEDGPTQAGAWAARLHPSEPAVVQADVRLDDCMDLKDGVGWVPLLAQVHDALLRIGREHRLALPRQSVDTHRLDRLVIEVAVAILEREGMRIRAVRAVFAEGAPAFPGSFLSEGFHVQVAVRDPDLIDNVDVVRAAPVASTAHAAPPVADPEDAGERMRRYFQSTSDEDLAEDIRRALTPSSAALADRRSLPRHSPPRLSMPRRALTPQEAT